MESSQAQWFVDQIYGEGKRPPVPAPGTPLSQWKTWVREVRKRIAETNFLLVTRFKRGILSRDMDKVHDALITTYLRCVRKWKARHRVRFSTLFWVAARRIVTRCLREQQYRRSHYGNHKTVRITSSSDSRTTRVHRLPTINLDLLIDQDQREAVECYLAGEAYHKPDLRRAKRTLYLAGKDRAIITDRVAVNSTDWSAWAPAVLPARIRNQIARKIWVDDDSDPGTLEHARPRGQVTT